MSLIQTSARPVMLEPVNTLTDPSCGFVVKVLTPSPERRRALEVPSGTVLR
jgi:hypothetical protein